MIFKQYLLPLIIIAFCYGRIVWMLTRRMDTTLETSSNESQMNKRFQVARTNTIKTLLIVGLFFVICWSCDEIYFLMYWMGHKANWNTLYFKFFVLMVFINSTVNPFIYLFKYKDYQIALKQFLGYKKKRETGQTSSSTATQNTELKF